VSAQYIISPRERILVTGANGFIGVKVVATLLSYGFANVRCFVRPSSRLDGLKAVLHRSAGGGEGVEVVSGDLLSRTDCQKAVEGVTVIYHLAAGFDKSFAGAFMNSALATRNLLDAFLQQDQRRRFVAVSSFAVYSNLKLNRDAFLDETCALEDAPQSRYDAYGFGKLKQEALVKDYGNRYNLPYVILRPGVVFGPGKTELSGRVGNGAFGLFVQVGGSNILPLTYVDNCAEAIVLGGLQPNVDGEIFNVVDDDLLTSRQFLKQYKKRIPGFRSIRIPYALAYGLSLLWERYSNYSKGQLPPAFNRRRCAADWKGNRYSNRKVRDRLGWRPRVSMTEAMASFLSQFEPAKR
jgi:nucleoside-diphosphate-sugar epimerase